MAPFLKSGKMTMFYPNALLTVITINRLLLSSNTLMTVTQQSEDFVQ